MKQNGFALPETRRIAGQSSSVGVKIIVVALSGFSPVRADEVDGPVRVHAGNLQQVIDSAAPHAIVHCDRNQSLTLTSTVTIRKPLTLVGLNARLPEKLGRSSLVIIESKGVALTDFELVGNADSVPQRERAPLVVVRAGDFRVERGIFFNSSKDGVMIDGAGSSEDIVGGVVRDVVGRGVVRDTVSISGGSGDGRRIRNVLVDNVRCHGSRLRGAVEVSDGTDNITVRKVFAESAVYAVDIQDHGQADQSNRNVVVEDVFAQNCKHALRTANSRKGHANLTIRDLTARQCTVPVQISHTVNVHLGNVRIADHDSKKSPIVIEDCHGLTIRDVIMENVVVNGAAIVVENGNDVLIDGLVLRGQSNDLANAVSYRVTNTETFLGLRISNVSARDVSEAGIVLEATKGGTLTDYLVTGNFATVRDQIKK